MAKAAKKRGPTRGPLFGLTREAGNLSTLSIVHTVQNLTDFQKNLKKSRAELIGLLRERSLLTDGPYTLRSGELSQWYLDGRRTTMDGHGATLVGRAVLGVLDPAAGVVGGLTMELTL